MQGNISVSLHFCVRIIVSYFMTRPDYSRSSVEAWDDAGRFTASGGGKAETMPDQVYIHCREGFRCKSHRTARSMTHSFPPGVLCLSSTGMTAIEMHMNMFLVLHMIEINIKWSVMRIHGVVSGMLPWWLYGGSERTVSCHLLAHCDAKIGGPAHDESRAGVICDRSQSRPWSLAGGERERERETLVMSTHSGRQGRRAGTDGRKDERKHTRR